MSLKPVRRLFLLAFLLAANRPAAIRIWFLVRRIGSCGGSSSNPALRSRRYGFQLRPGSGSSVNSGPFTISGRLIALMGLASGPWITAVKILPSRKMGPFTFKKAHWADQTGV